MYINKQCPVFIVTESERVEKRIEPEINVYKQQPLLYDTFAFRGKLYDLAGRTLLFIHTAGSLGGAVFVVCFYLNKNVCM